MEHYYTNKKNISKNELVITDDEAHHLKNVLRKKTGNEIFVTDGERNLYKSHILEIDKDKILCKITEKYYDLKEPKRKIHLYLALLKNPSRFEFAIEKSVEIGVNEITPIITEHVINKKMNPEKSGLTQRVPRTKVLNKVERWQSIALSAMKQSQRCYLPRINNPIYFNNVISSPLVMKGGALFLADEKEDSNTSFSLLNNDFTKKEDSNTIFSLLSDNISLFIGPEGGFTDEEVDMARKNGFQIISLGKRKLRSETAAIVGISKLIELD